MRRLGFLVRAELFKLAKYRLAWGLLAAMLLIVLLGIRGDLRRAQEGTPPDPNLPAVLQIEYKERVTLPGTLDQVPASFELLNVFVLLLTIIVAGQDFDWGSVRTVLCRMPARGWLLAARFLALAAGSAVLVLALWATRFLAALPAGRILGSGALFSLVDGRTWLHQGPMLLHTWLSTWPAIAFGLLAAVAVRNVALSITLGGLGYFVGWMTLMLGLALLPFILRPATEVGLDPATVELGFWGLWPTLTPHFNMAAVAHWGDAAGMAQDPSLTLVALLALSLPHGPWRGLGLLLLYCAVFLVAARWAFWQRDMMR